MEQQLTRRLVWVLGADARGDRTETALEEVGAPYERFERADVLIEALAERRPEVVLVTTNMFGQPDGLEVFVDRLRRSGSARVPVVAITDDGSVEMRRRMFKAGIDDFVLEPVVASELITRVDSQLRLNSGAGQFADVEADGAGAVFAGEQPDGPLSVLVADAEKMVHRVLRASFERRGWFVAEANDGSEATDLLDEHEFDLVVFDLNLPFKNGFELLGELGGAAASKRPRLVVLSAEKQQESVLRAFELGADDFVSKPVNPDILVARIERLVRPAVRG